MRRRLNYVDLTCPECEYRLTGLRTPRCPECGTAFNPRELRARRLIPVYHIMAGGLDEVMEVLRNAEFNPGVACPPGGRGATTPVYVPFHEVRPACRVLTEWERTSQIRIQPIVTSVRKSACRALILALVLGTPLAWLLSDELDFGDCFLATALLFIAFFWILGWLRRWWPTL